MTSSAPRPPVSKELRQYFDWVESRIKSGDIVAGQLEQRVGAAQQQSTIIGGLASNNSAQQAVIDDRTVSQSDTNRLARPLVEETFWNSVIAGTRTIFTAGDGELSVARNVSWSNGSLVFQPNTEESAEIHVTNILTAPESRKVYVEALYTVGLEPEIWVEQRDVDGNQVEGIAPIVVTGKGTVTLSATGGIVAYSVRLVRPVNAGIAAVGNVKVFEVIGTGGMNISPEGIVVENPAGDKTLEINPELAILAAPTTPTLGSSMGTVAVHWDGLLTSGPTPAHFGYVYAEESVDGVNNWLRAGQPLNKSGDILVRPPVGETRFYRLTAVDTSNRSSAPSASHSIVVGGVLIPDLDSEITDAIDEALFQAGEAGEAAAAAQQTANDAEAAAAQAALDATNKSAAAEAAAKTYADAEAAAAQAAAEAAASDDATAKANAAQAAAEAAAAADALQKANAARDAAIAVADAAQDTADTAAADAEAAKEEARAAQTTADGKNRIYTQVASPGDSLFVNGSFEVGAGSVEIARNRVTNPSAEIDASGWGAARATLTRDTGQSRYGDASFKVVVSDTSSSQYMISNAGSASRFPVTGGETVDVIASVRPAVTAPQFALQLYEYDSSGVLLTPVITGDAVDCRAGAWTDIHSPLTVKANAASVRVVVIPLGAFSTIGDTYWVDGIGLGVDKFFDGSQVPKVARNLAQSPTPAAGTTWSPGSSITAMSDGTPCLEVTASGSSTPYIFSATSAEPAFSGETYTMKAKFQVVGDAADATYTFRIHSRSGNVYFASGGQSIVATGGVQEVTVVGTLNADVIANSLDFAMVRDGAAGSAGAKLRMGRVVTVKGEYTGDPFDGSSAPAGFGSAWEGAVNASPSYLYDADLSVAWVGAANASAATLAGSGVSGVSGSPYTGARGFQSSRWASSGSKSLRISAWGTGGSSNAAVAASAIPMLAGETYTITATVHLEAPLTGTNENYARRLRAGSSSRGFAVSPQAPNEAGDHEIRWVLTPEADVTTFQLWHGGMPGSPDIWWDNLVILKGDVEKPFAQGDLWYVLDPADASRVSGVRIWDGATWRDYQIVADSVIVPGSIDGGTLIKDGTVTSNKVLMDEGFADKFWANEANFGQVTAEMVATKSLTSDQLAANSITSNEMVVGVLDGQTLKGVYIEAPTIASGPNLGAADILPDPDMTSAVDTSWVASGFLGDSAPDTQTDTITWDHTNVRTTGSWRMRGNVVAKMTAKPIVRATGSLTFISTDGIFDNVASRAISNPYDYEKVNYPASAETDQSLPAVKTFPPSRSTGTPRTTYLTNSGSAAVTAGENLRLEYSIASSGAWFNDAAGNLTVTVQLLNKATNTVVWEEKSPQGTNVAEPGDYVRSITSPITGNVTIRFKTDYTWSAGGLDRRIEPGSWYRRDQLSGNPHPLYPDWYQDASGYALDYGYNPNLSVSPGASVNDTGRWGAFSPARNLNISASVTRASLSKLSPSSGFQISADGGFQTFNQTGAITSRLDGENNLFMGTVRTAEDGPGVVVEGSKVSVTQDVDDENSTVTTFISPGEIAVASFAANQFVHIAPEGILFFDPAGYTAGLAATEVLWVNSRPQSYGTDAERLAIGSLDLENGMKFYCTDTGLEWVRRDSQWFLSPGQVLADMVGPTANAGGASVLIGSIISTPVLPIGQRVKIIANFSQYDTGSTVSAVRTAWRNNAANVSYSVNDNYITSRAYEPAGSSVVSGRGANALFTTTVAAKVSAAIYTESAASQVYGADGTYLRIESA